MIATLALIDFAAKSAALFALGLAVAALVTPRLRVLVHRATFVLALLLPLTFAIAAPRATLFAVETEAVLKDVSAPATRIVYDVAAQPIDFVKLTSSAAVNDTPEMKPLTPAPKPLVINWLAVLFGVWACGALFVMLRFVRSYLGLARAYAGGHDHPQLWLAMRAVQRDVGLDGEVDVRVSGAVASPCTFGLLKPRILLPAGCDFGDETLNAVLAHEMHHIRHNDSAWLAAGRFACAVHWFNPLAWMALHRFRGDIEVVCDDAVSRNTSVQTYAGALIDAARQSIAFKPAAGVSMSSHGVAARIRRLLEREDHLPMPTRLSRGLLLATAAAALLMLQGTTIVAARPQTTDASLPMPKVAEIAVQPSQPSDAEVSDDAEASDDIEVSHDADDSDDSDEMSPSDEETDETAETRWPAVKVTHYDADADRADLHAQIEAARAQAATAKAQARTAAAQAMREHSRVMVDSKKIAIEAEKAMNSAEVRRAMAEASARVAEAGEKASVEVQKALKALKAMPAPKIHVIAPMEFNVPVPPPGEPRMIVVGDNAMDAVTKGHKMRVQIDRDLMDNNEEGLLLLDVDRGVTVRATEAGFMCGDDAHCRFTMERGTQVRMTVSANSPDVTWHHCANVSSDGRSCTVTLGDKAVHVWVMAKT